MLEIINQAMEKLGTTARWKKVPSLEGCDALKGKRLFVIDDVQGLLELYIPHLIAATGREVGFIHYRDQTVGEMVCKIREAAPEVLLLDQGLSKSLKGTDVAQVLAHHNFEGRIVGFSAESSAFEEMGFKSVEKSGSIITTLQSLNELLAQ